MEANIINLEHNKDQQTIIKWVLHIVKQLNVNHIYFITGNTKSKVPYRFILIIEDMAKRFKQRVKEILEEILEEYPLFQAQFFTLNYIQNMTSEGNTFFLNHCTQETLIYYHNSYDEKWLFHYIDLTDFALKANENFAKQEEKITGFKNGADLFLEKKSYGHAAFMLHQMIEHSFLAAEYFLMGKTFTGHLISDHQTYIDNSQQEFENIFPRQNKTDTNLLNKLNKAYCDTRYTLNYHIKEEQVVEIYKRANRLIELVKAKVEAEILICENLLKSNISHQPVVNSNKEEEQKRTHSETDYDFLVHKIKRLGKENFRTLTPIDGIRKGYYLNYARVYDYFDLFALLESTLNVCILALEEQQDCTLDIKNKESDVKTVLAFAKNFIPLEEANFLDKMRELLATEKEGSQIKNSHGSK